MLVLIDVVADVILLALDLRLLAGRQRAVAHVVRLGAVDALLLMLEARGLVRRQLARLQALLDARLLRGIARGLGGGRLREGAAAGQSRDRDDDECSFHEASPGWVMPD